MSKRDKYEVVDFVRGGFFISGGSITETYIKTKEDADLICAALNMVERLNVRRTQRRVQALISDLEALDKALTEGTEENY